MWSGVTSLAAAAWLVISRGCIAYDEAGSREWQLHMRSTIIIVIQVLTQGTLRTPRSDLEWLYKCQRRSFIGTRLIDPHIGHTVEIDRVFVESKTHLSHDFVNEKLS